MGYLALLRNLRNMREANVEESLVLAAVSAERMEALKAEEEILASTTVDIGYVGSKGTNLPIDLGDLRQVVCADCHTGGVGP